MLNPVSPDSEILLTDEELDDEAIALLGKALSDTFFSPGYGGDQWGWSEKKNLMDGPWSLQRIPISRLIRPEQFYNVLAWLREEEEEQGISWPPIEPGTADPEMPIIVGPSWAFSKHSYQGLEDYIILDGWHRTAAALRAGIPTLDVFVTEGEGVEEDQ